MIKQEVVSILKKFQQDLDSPAQLLPNSRFLQITPAGSGGVVRVEALNFQNNGGTITANGGNAIAEMNVGDFNDVQETIGSLIDSLENDEREIPGLLKKLRNSPLPSAVYSIVLNLVSAVIAKSAGI